MFVEGLLVREVDAVLSAVLRRQVESDEIKTVCTLPRRTNHATCKFESPCKRTGRGWSLVAGVLGRLLKIGKATWL